MSYDSATCCILTKEQGQDPLQTTEKQKEDKTGLICERVRMFMHILMWHIHLHTYTRMYARPHTRTHAHTDTLSRATDV